MTYPPPRLSPLIVISLEGLSVSALGCYGSSWNETPAIDRLASRGCVWDRFLATTDQPTAVLADWTGRNAAWAHRLRSSLGPIELITDSDSGDLRDGCFDEVLYLPPESSPADSLPAQEIVDTQFGQLVAAALERDSRNPPWGVLWIHSRFLTRCWDAPRDLVLRDEEFADDRHCEEQPSDEYDSEDFSSSFENDVNRDARPIESLQGIPPLVFPTTVPPELELNDESHPDLVTAWMRTYGCQVRLVDLLVEVMLQTLQAKDPTVLIAGTSGFRLGQGGIIGHRNGPLRSPDIRLPLIVGRGGPLHVPQLTPSDQLGEVLSQLGDPAHSICSPSSWCRPSTEAATVETASDRANRVISSPGWFYVADSDQSDHLFLKPDDVDDFNDVGRLRGDVIEMLRSEMKNGPANL